MENHHMDDEANAEHAGNDAENSAPPPTLSARFLGVSIQGWSSDDEDEARLFGAVLMGYVKGYSCWLDLSRLESVVVAWDYKQALSDIVSGGDFSFTPTENEYGSGQAMAAHVIREDEIWSVVVLSHNLIRPLSDESLPGYDMAAHLLFHELVHVNDLCLVTKTYPGGWKAIKPRDGRDAVLQPIVNPCQSEYSAQRMSAWLAPEHGVELLDLLEGSIRDVETQIREARLSYRLHGDMDIYWPVVKERMGFLFQAIGYGLGHSDWVEGDADSYPEIASKFRAGLERVKEYSLGWMVDECREAVQPFWDMTEWVNQDVYDPLIAILERALNQFGMYTSVEGDGIYVDMPYTGLHDL